MTTVLLQLEKLQTPFNGLYTVSEQLAKTMSLLKPSDIDLLYYLPESFIGEFGQTVQYRTISKLHKKLPFTGPKVEIWHNLHQDCRFLPSRKKTKFIITVNDLNFLYENFNETEKVRRLAILQKRIQRADVLVAISQYVKSDLEKHLDIQCPIEVIYIGCEPILEPANKPNHPIKKPFLLCLGTVLAKKNYHAILPLLQNLPDYELVIAGGHSNSCYMDFIEEQAKALGIADRVRLLGAVNAPEKRWLYEHCEALLCPSLTEGFGLPIVEAMQYGKPVFLSTFTCLPEVGGDLAFYFTEYNADSLFSVFERGMQIYRNTDLAASLKDRAKMFTWEDCAKQYFSLYRRFL